MSRRFGTVPFISVMFLNVKHSTDEGHSPETSGHLFIFGTFSNILNLCHAEYEVFNSALDSAKASERV